MKRDEFFRNHMLRLSRGFTAGLYWSSCIHHSSTSVLIGELGMFGLKKSPGQWFFKSTFIRLGLIESDQTDGSLSGCTWQSGFAGENFFLGEKKLVLVKTAKVICLSNYANFCRRDLFFKWHVDIFASSIKCTNF